MQRKSLEGPEFERLCSVAPPADDACAVVLVTAGTRVSAMPNRDSAEPRVTVASASVSGISADPPPDA